MSELRDAVAEAVAGDPDWDAEGVATAASDMAGMVLGAEPEQVLGEFSPDLDTPRVRAALQVLRDAVTVEVAREKPGRWMAFVAGYEIPGRFATADDALAAGTRMRHGGGFPVRVATRTITPELVEAISHATEAVRTYLDSSTVEAATVVAEAIAGDPKRLDMVRVALERAGFDDAPYVFALVGRLAGWEV